jgi:aconitate hydratase
MSWCRPGSRSYRGPPRAGGELTVHDRANKRDYLVRHRLSPRQIAMVLAGGQIPLVRSRETA